MEFAKFAPYLQDPLVLVGFVIFLFFGLTRAIVRAGLIPTLSQASGYRVLRIILLYGFLLGVLVAALGFGLKYRELSSDEQLRTAKLIRSELSVNRRVLGEMTANTEQMVGIFHDVASSLREKRIPIIATLFPEENLTLDDGAPASSELARRALRQLESRGLLRDSLEVRKATAAGEVIAGTLRATRGALVSLQDAEHSRYSISRHSFEANAGLLRRISRIDMTNIQRVYGDLERVRSNYDVVAGHVVAYLDAVGDLFSSSQVIDVERLTVALAAERLSINTLVQYTDQLIQMADAAESAVASFNRAVDAL